MCVLLDICGCIDSDIMDHSSLNINNTAVCVCVCVCLLCVCVFLCTHVCAVVHLIE